MSGSGIMKPSILMKMCKILGKSSCSGNRSYAIPVGNVTGRDQSTQFSEDPEHVKDRSLDVVEHIAEKCIGKMNIFESEKKFALEIQRLTTELSVLLEQKNDFEDKYKRALAESENLRHRLTKQIEKAKQFGIVSFCRDTLEVADILGTAIKSVPTNEVSNNNPHLKNLFEGLTMTNASLMQVLKRHGVEPINPINQKFNPNLHEALCLHEANDAEPNTVVLVSKIGYKLHDICLRPALVEVSKN